MNALGGVMDRRIWSETEDSKTQDKKEEKKKDSALRRFGRDLTELAAKGLCRL